MPAAITINRDCLDRIADGAHPLVLLFTPVVVDVDVGDEDFEVEEDEVFDTEKVGSVEKILIGVVDVDLVEEVLLVVDDDEVEV